MDTLHTERLTIRPYTMDDLIAAHEILDKDLYWSGPDFSLDKRRNRLERDIHLADWSDVGGLYGWRAIVLRDTEMLMGQCGFLPGWYSPEKQDLFFPQLFGDAYTSSPYASFEMEIGYAIASNHQRNGYGAEAINAILAYAFDTLSFSRIFASTNRSNVGSIGLMHKVGMRTAPNPEHPELEWPGHPWVLGVIEN
ncbi:MAG: GNAT family N-acetyltransferase [Chloroflexota bacterium]